MALFEYKALARNGEVVTLEQVELMQQLAEGVAPHV